MDKLFEKKEDHPSYGMVGISHWQSSGTRLAGSEFIHQHGVSLTIRRAQKCRDLSREWWFANKELISVNLSEAQLVELIGRPNMGDGVVCTINHVLGERMPDPPEAETMKQKSRADFKKSADECAKGLREALAEMEAALDSGAGKKVLRDIHKKFWFAAKAIDDEIPWVQHRFEEEMEKTVRHAATEIEATVTQTAIRLGIERMQEMRESAPKLIEGETAAPQIEGDRQ